MFRRTSTILGSDAKLDVTTAARLWALDADIIMTAVVLGFSAGHLAKGHPVTFHAPAGGELEKLERAVDGINAALGERHRFQSEVHAAASPEWQRGARTTGAELPRRFRSPVVQDDEHLLALLNDSIRSVPGVRDTETFVYLRLAKQTYSWGTR